MATRIVEGKKPYTGGKAITVDENKVISLNLREENNLIIYDEGDDEIYVDLQLKDGIRPTDAFPVGCNTGRALVADDWDVTGTLVCFKTTSGDNIKLLYGDDGKVYIDNGTGIFKQIYLKGEVDALIQALKDYVDAQLALKQDKLIAGENISIAADGKTISATVPTLSRFLSIWDCSTGEPISFPASVPFNYESGDFYLVENVDTTTNYRPSGSSYTGQASTTPETDTKIANGDVYIYDGLVWLLQYNTQKEVAFQNIAGDPYDNTNLGNALSAKQDSLTLPSTPTQGNLVVWGADNETFADGGAVPTVPTNVSAFNNDSGYITSSSLPGTATSSTAGIVKLASDTAQSVAAEAVSSTAGRTYGVQLNSSNQMVVNVPRTDSVTSVNGNTGAVTVSEFTPSGTATTGYVVTKTANGYEWAAPAGGIQLAPNTELNVKYHRYGSQASYDSLNQYYTDTANDTAYFTIQ